MSLFYSHTRFTALFPGPSGWAGARRELLDFMVQRKINRGRHTDNPAGRHSIQTKQCPTPPCPHFLWAGCPSCRLTNSVKALKATSAFRFREKMLEFSTVLPAPSPYQIRQCLNQIQQFCFPASGQLSSALRRLMCRLNSSNIVDAASQKSTWIKLLGIQKTTNVHLRFGRFL